MVDRGISARSRLLPLALGLGFVGFIGAAAAALSFLACSDDGRRRAPTPSDALVDTATPPRKASADLNPRLLRRFRALPERFSDTSVERSRLTIDLGRKLFYETRLSRDGSLSCNGCHDLQAYGVDGLRVSKGIDSQLGSRNAPTLYNAAGAFVQFWDGRSPTVEEQAKAPILHPSEMGMPASADVIEALRADPAYVEGFRAAFPEDAEPLRWDNVGRAIGAFERGLATPGRWDRFLRGDTDALDRAERDGLKTFLDVGCMVCHTGPLLGGSMYERVGLVVPWPNQKDRGRGAITHRPKDDMVFRVPSLRNVAKTAPYFHDGSVATLEEAVAMMGRHQLGLDLADTDVRAITTWLKSLTGELPQDYIARPGPREHQ